MPIDFIQVILVILPPYDGGSGWLDLCLSCIMPRVWGSLMDGVLWMARDARSSVHTSQFPERLSLTRMTAVRSGPELQRIPRTMIAAQCLEPWTQKIAEKEVKSNISHRLERNKARSDVCD